MNRVLQSVGVLFLAGITVFCVWSIVQAGDEGGPVRPAGLVPVDAATFEGKGADPVGVGTPAPATADPGKPVDLAICLDTSGSMDGLIDAARRKLWDITNELATAKPTPRLRVALLTYGNDGHNAETGWVRVDHSFTEDLDAIYQQLFALRTNGGTEFVGRVLKASIEQLEWTPAPDALKLIFVAGNESADQDTQVPFRDICRKAIAQGIMVNAIYCGPAADGIAPAWREVALLADGQFASIDQNHGTVEVMTPFDQALAAQSTALNATYLPVGGEGQAAWQNQAAQDANAASTSIAAAASRAQTKSGKCYVCTWDLVDLVQQKEFDWAKVRDEDLPEAMRKMTAGERRAHVALMAQKRGDIQKQI
ncbi:MAG: VWA domain-containing protein, partial [Planctomycetes bacterium]|nr:VWA domain-containing protein [Planctomycetota bacterium]